MIKHRAAEKGVREAAVELIGLFNIPNVIREQLDVQALQFPTPNDRDNVRGFLHDVRQSEILQTNTRLVGNTINMSGAQHSLLTVNHARRCATLATAVSTLETRLHQHSQYRHPSRLPTISITAAVMSILNLGSIRFTGQTRRIIQIFPISL